MNVLKETLSIYIEIRKWSGRMHDAGASAEVNAMKQADAKAARVNRHIVPPSYLTGINRIDKNARTYVKEQSLPFVAGQNLIAANQVFEITHTLNQFKQHYIEQTENLCRQHHLLPAIARKHLGALYNPSDLPSEDQLRAAFSFQFDFFPVAQGNDWLTSKITNMNEHLENYKNKCADQEVQINRSQIQDLLIPLAKHYNDLPGLKRIHENKFHDHITVADRVLAKNAITKSPEVNKAAYFVKNAISTIDTGSVAKDRRQALDMLKQSIDYCNEQLEALDGTNTTSQSKLFEMFSPQSDERPVYGSVASTA